VNETLQDELKSGVHALSIVVSVPCGFPFFSLMNFNFFHFQQAKTPLQWEESSKTVEKSPACKGGFGK